MARLFPRIMLAFALAAVPLSAQTGGGSASAISEVSAQTDAVDQQVDCPFFDYRAWDDNLTSEARGVSGIFRLPQQGTIGDREPGQGSAAGVYLEDWYGRGDFVQIGWYVGHFGQLPFTLTPRVFFGEYYPGQAGDEYLRPGVVLSWNSYHVFKLFFSTSTGYYNFYVDGDYVGRSLLRHSSKGKPGAVGEVANAVNDYCITMWGEAHRAVEPYQSLIYLLFNPSATWHFFNDFYAWDAPYVAEAFAGEQATALLLGPAS